MTAERYTGEPISVDFRDTALAEVWKYFEQVSGLNIVADPAVEGALTLRLADVPWDQAFEIILRRCHLGYTLEGNVVQLAPLPKLIREEAARRTLAKNAALAGDVVRVIRRLENARAGEMSAMLLSTVVTPRGYVLHDERTNSVIITDLPKAVAEAEEMMDRLDVPVGSPPASTSAESEGTPKTVITVQNLQIAGDGGTLVQAETFQGSAIGRMIGNRLEGSLNIAESASSADVRDALKALHLIVEEMLLRLPAEANEEDVVNSLETLTRQASQRRPIKEIVKAAGDRLVEAGKIAQAAGQLGTALKKVTDLIGLAGLF